MLKFAISAIRFTPVSSASLIQVDASLSSKSVSVKNLSSFLKKPHLPDQFWRAVFLFAAGMKERNV